jgi:hypothetical protein
MAVFHRYRARTFPASAARISILASLAVAAALALGASPAAAAAPQAHTEGASSVTFSSAVLNGSANPNHEASEYFFQYGTTRKFGSTTPVQPLGSGGTKVHVTQAVTGLQAFTTYYFRIVVTSAAGASIGATVAFKTPKIPLSVAIVAVPNPVPFGAPFTVEGTLSGTGAANHQIMLQANPFPYTNPFGVVGNVELTNAAGGFSFPVLGMTQNTQLRVMTVGAPSVSSPVVTEQVAVRVSLRVHRMRRRGRARLSGTVEPAEVGALVGFQRLVPGHRTVNVGGTDVKPLSATRSQFSRVIRVHRGIYEALVQVNDGAHVSGTSLPVLIH